MMASTSRSYEFGPFRLDVDERRLLRDGAVVLVKPKVFDVLVLLVANRGRLLTKEFLLGALWPGTFVEEANLNVNVSALRRALGDSPTEPVYVETVPKQGYRFIAPVTEAGVPLAEPQRAVAGSTPGEPRPERPPADALAVLPFANVDDDPEIDYFVDGVTESVINALSRLPGLRVVARSTVFRYKGRDVTPAEVASELRVRGVVTGRVRHVGDRLQIGAELVDADEGVQLWGDHYDRSAAEVFDLQREIACEIAEKLRVRLGDDDRARLAKRHTESLDAYRLYLKGRYFWEKRSVDGLRRALECFSAAIDLDPGYALAFAGLADCHALRSNYDTIAPRETMLRAKAAAARALDLDPGLAEGYTSRGLVRKDYDWDFAGADADFRRAIELNPNYATAYHWLAENLVAVGRPAEALAAVERALEVDPLSLMVSAKVAWVLLHQREYDRAAEQCRRTLELDSRFWLARLYLGWAYEGLGRYADAAEEYVRAREASSDHVETLASLGRAEVLLGRLDEAHAMLEEIERRPAAAYVSPVAGALIHAALDDHERAMDLLDRAFEERDTLLVYFVRFPAFDALESHQRFVSLLERMGLPRLD